MTHYILIFPDEDIYLKYRNFFNEDWFKLVFLFVQGRKEIMSLLNRRKYKEMMLASLEKKRLRMSPLDMRFHLRDLIGSGHLETDLTPTGLIVRVSKD